MLRLPGRLLVDMPNWLGDFVHTLPALGALLAGNRGGVTTVLVPPAHVPLARLVGVEVITRPRGAGWLWARRHLVGRFDVAVSARHSTRAKLILVASGAAVRLASTGRGAKLMGITTFLPTRSRHQRNDLNDALARLGLPAPPPEPTRLHLPDQLVAAGRESRRRLTLDGPAVAIFPGTKGLASKRYPTASFAKVAAGLARHGVKPLVVVGPGEETLAAAIAAASGAAVAPSRAPLDEIAALLHVLDAAVGNDSGLSHLAAVVGCPTIAIFGPTDPDRTGPVGGGEVLRPAARKGGELPGPLESLAPDDVVAAIIAALAANPARRP